MTVSGYNSFSFLTSSPWANMRCVHDKHPRPKPPLPSVRLCGPEADKERESNTAKTSDLDAELNILSPRASTAEMLRGAQFRTHVDAVQM